MNRMRLIVLVIICLTFSVHSALADYDRCYNAGNTIQINVCLAGEFEKVDEKLNQTFQKILNDLEESAQSGSASSEDARTKLLKAQELWKQVRELDCEAVYESWREGSIRNTKSLVCEIEKTKNRNNFLTSSWHIHSN